MSTDRSRRSDPARQRGLSLVEVLVGLLVGMIGILVIFQTMSVWDKHTRTTASGGDARTAGTLAIYNIERDLKLAGMGFGTADLAVMGCAVTTSGPPAFPLVPVSIVSSASGPDTIDVLYGSSAFFVSTEKFVDSSSFTKKMKRRGGFKAGDLAIVASNGASAASANCHLIEVTDVSNVDGVTLGHNQGAYNSYYAASAAASFNSASGTGTTYTAGTMYSLGPQPRLNRWEVSNGSLVSTDLIHAAPTRQVAEGVVDLKAQYGYDTDGDMKIAAAEWTTAAPTDWTKVLAVRIAVLVRSRQYEKDADSPYAGAASAPSWFGGQFVMRNLDGTTGAASGPNNWRDYRYRVYERVVPLRNMLWGTI